MYVESYGTHKKEYFKLSFKRIFAMYLSALLNGI